MQVNYLKIAQHIINLQKTHTIYLKQYTNQKQS